MIERWLQITCDNEDCGETDNSTAPNMSVEEFLEDLRGCFVKRGNKHYCATCDDIMRSYAKKRSK